MRKYDSPGKRKREQQLEQQRVKELQAGQDLEEDETKEEKKRAILSVGSYDFHECPVAYTVTDRWVLHLISLVNWSEEMHTSLSGGGLTSFTNFYFECRNIIVSEQRKIENEELDKNKRKGSIGKEGKGRKAGMGKKGSKGGKGPASKGLRRPAKR